MNCKICNKKLLNIINELYMCKRDNDITDWRVIVESDEKSLSRLTKKQEGSNLHTYTTMFSREKKTISSEEYRIIDAATNRGYIVFLNYIANETKLKIAVGSEIIQSRTIENTIINLDFSSEESLISKMEKLMVLF